MPVDKRYRMKVLSSTEKQKPEPRPPRVPRVRIRPTTRQIVQAFKRSAGYEDIIARIPKAATIPGWEKGTKVAYFSICGKSGSAHGWICGIAITSTMLPTCSAHSTTAEPGSHIKGTPLGAPPKQPQDASTAISMQPSQEITPAWSSYRVIRPPLARPSNASLTTTASDTSRSRGQSYNPTSARSRPEDIIFASVK